MRMSKAVRRFLEAAKQTNTYWTEKAKLDFSIKLEEHRRANGMSYKDLAQAAEVSQPYITKVFRGDANLTIESMVKFARAVGGNLELNIVESSAASSWNSKTFQHSVARPTRPRLSVLTPSSTIATEMPASNGDHWSRLFQKAA